MENTSTKRSPWYVIPADDKWYTRAAIADIITHQLTAMDLRYPEVSEEQRATYLDLAARLGSNGPASADTSIVEGGQSPDKNESTTIVSALTDSENSI